MKMNDIIAVIRDLSYSQGFYGRVLRNLMELKENDYESFIEVSNALEAKNFKEPLDVVLFFEC